MWIRRKYLSDADLSCKVEHLSQVSTVVQDRNTTVQRIVERSANGVINPDTLRNSGYTYQDIGMPVNMSVLDRLDMMRANAERIVALKDALTPPAPVLVPPAPSVPPTEPSVPPAT